MNDNQTALVRFGPLPYDVVVQANGKTYTFKNHNGVSMAWVDNEDVEAVLMVRHTCCGGKKSRTFQLANSAQIAHWEAYR